MLNIYLYAIPEKSEEDELLIFLLRPCPSPDVANYSSKGLKINGVTAAPEREGLTAVPHTPFYSHLHPSSCALSFLCSLCSTSDSQFVELSFRMIDPRGVLELGWPSELSKGRHGA